MKNAKTQKQQAIEAIAKFGNNKRFKQQIEQGLAELNGIIKKELRFSKDLRNVRFIEDMILERKYYKFVLENI
jgi:hypothetical protein